MARPDVKDKLATLKRRYVAAAVYTFNVLVAFAVVNLLLWPVIVVWPRVRRDPHNPSQFPKDRLRRPTATCRWRLSRGP